MFFLEMILADKLIRKSSFSHWNHRLRPALINSGLKTLWEPDSDLLLWILSIGAIIADDDEEFSWFADLAGKAMGTLVIESEHELKEMLSSVFYLEKIQHAETAKLYQRVTDLQRDLRP